MTKFLFITKTPWNEPPRIRHQLAYLLANAGYEVYFSEKPANWPIQINTSFSDNQKIRIYQFQELIHHKLRLHSFIHKLNSIFTVRSIRKNLAKIQMSEIDIILNFNYDYYFLKEVFPNCKIVTIINDEVLSRALVGYQKPIMWAKRKCLEMSDAVFTVSNRLQNDLKKFSQVELLLPWADRNYIQPKLNSNRKTLLYWGYINYRVDFELIEEILKDHDFLQQQLNILFVGPTDKKSKRIVERLDTYTNFSIAEPASLDEIHQDELLAGFMPYRDDIQSIKAATLPNKSLQLLARGLPLVISSMPDFIQKPFVFRISKGNFRGVFHKVADQFDNMQPEIEKFVEKNTGEARLNQLKTSLSLE